MATVYLARDTRHNRKVALKVLRPDLGAILGVDRFLSEIEVTANLQHPNLLPLFDSGEANGLLFYVMPFIEGESLRARLDREKQLPIEVAVHIAAAVAGALDYAHRHGVIHRDLKPENILMHEGEPLVADFGIALAVSNAGGNRMTQTGLSLGTPQYMSPEQATGDRVLDARSDIYALGAVTYEMVTGEPPHSGKTAQAIIARVLTERPRAVRASRASVPVHVEAAIDRALEKLPSDRFGTAKEFSEALTGARPVTLSHTALMQAATHQTTQVLVPERKRPAWREMAGWTIAAIALMATGYTAFSGRSAAAPGVQAQFEIGMPDSTAVSFTGTSGAIAVSPDGSTIVFQATRAGGPQAMYVRRLSDRVVQLIRGTEGGLRPTFSPDGSEILFATAGALRRVSLQGGTPRTISDSSGTASWGDNHQVITTNQSKLWLVSEDGGAPVLLAAPDSSRRHIAYGTPKFLPGSRAALLTIRVGRNILDSTRLAVVTVPEGKITELGSIRGTHPQYVASGYLFYTSIDGVLFAVPFSASSLKVTGSPFPVADGVLVGTGGLAAYAVGLNGTLAWVAGESSAGNRSLYAVSRTGVERDLGAIKAAYQTPRVSPNGRDVALTIFTRALGGPNQTGPDPDIWRFDLVSHNLSRLTTDSNSQRAVWSPDGERIAYIVGKDFGSTTAAARDAGVTSTMDADSSVRWRGVYATAKAEALVTGSGRMATIVMGRPHGYLAVVTTNGPNTGNILLGHMDTARVLRPLFNEPYDEYAPAISPDGKLIAYVTNRTGRSEVYVRSFPDAGPEVRVSMDGGSEPVWALNGRELFFRSPSKMMAAQVITAPRLDIGKRDTLFTDGYIKNRTANYDVLPGGREFVMIRGALITGVVRPLVVTTNWRAPAAGKP